jgi:hypothetical protein
MKHSIQAECIPPCPSSPSSFASPGSPPVVVLPSTPDTIAHFSADDDVRRKSLSPETSYHEYKSSIEGPVTSRTSEVFAVGSWSADTTAVVTPSIVTEGCTDAVADGSSDKTPATNKDADAVADAANSNSDPGGGDGNGGERVAGIPCFDGSVPLPLTTTGKADAMVGVGGADGVSDVLPQLSSLEGVTEGSQTLTAARADLSTTGISEGGAAAGGEDRSAVRNKEVLAILCDGGATI